MRAEDFSLWQRRRWPPKSVVEYEKKKQSGPCAASHFPDHHFWLITPDNLNPRWLTDGASAIPERAPDPRPDVRPSRRKKARSGNSLAQTAKWQGDCRHVRISRQTFALRAFRENQRNSRSGGSVIRGPPLGEKPCRIRRTSPNRHRISAEDRAGVPRGGADRPDRHTPTDSPARTDKIESGLTVDAQRGLTSVNSPCTSEKKAAGIASYHGRRPTIKPKRVGSARFAGQHLAPLLPSRQPPGCGRRAAENFRQAMGNVDDTQSVWRFAPHEREEGRFGSRDRTTAASLVHHTKEYGASCGQRPFAISTICCWRRRACLHPGASGSRRTRSVELHAWASAINNAAVD